MKTSAYPALVQPLTTVDVSCDVSKDKINAVILIDSTVHEDEFQNRTDTIERKLRQYLELAQQYGRRQLRVVCEPTGGYQDKLLRAARRLGQRTAFVNVESVAKMRVVETNDSGKTDLKDPFVIGTLARLGKTQLHRILDEDYLCLRRLGKRYDETEVSRVQLLCRIHSTLRELFCDFSFKKDFLLGRSGAALLEFYGGNPYRIRKVGFGRFRQAMKRRAPRIQEKSLRRLWNDAECSVRNDLPGAYVTLLEQQLREQWADLKRLDDRLKSLKEQLEELYDRVSLKDSKLPTASPGIISRPQLARLIAETGPLSDFQNAKKLLRYGGLNLRMRQSGKYEGQTKISKKGRSRLRKVLSQIVLPLVRKTRLLGDYYHKKKLSMPGSKAMTAAMRLFLRKLFGWYRSGQPFSEERFVCCESQLKVAV